jgi:hypothetical protein
MLPWFSMWRSHSAIHLTEVENNPRIGEGVGYRRRTWNLCSNIRDIPSPPPSYSSHPSTSFLYVFIISPFNFTWVKNNLIQNDFEEPYYFFKKRSSSASCSVTLMEVGSLSGATDGVSVATTRPNRCLPSVLSSWVKRQEVKLTTCLSSV